MASLRRHLGEALSNPWIGLDQKATTFSRNILVFTDASDEGYGAATFPRSSNATEALDQKRPRTTSSSSFRPAATFASSSVGAPATIARPRRLAQQPTPSSKQKSRERRQWNVGSQRDTQDSESDIGSLVQEHKPGDAALWGLLAMVMTLMRTLGPMGSRTTPFEVSTSGS